MLFTNAAKVTQIKVASLLLNNFTRDVRVLKECQSLINNNYNVKVFAVWNKGIKTNETYNQLSVKRIKISSKKLPKNLIWQILKYCEYLTKTIIALIHYNPSIIHCNDLNTLPIGGIYKLLSLGRKKIVYDAHEYETEVNGLSGIRKFVTQLTERFFIKLSDQNITVSDSIANEYVKNYGITKPTVVMNCPPYQDHIKSKYFYDKFNLSSDTILFFYQGSFSPKRGIEFIIDAFKQLKNSKCKVIFIGEGSLMDTIIEATKLSTNILFHPVVPPMKLREIATSVDVGICLMENSCLNHFYCLPNKLFEYIQARVPMISTDLFELRKVVNDPTVGWLVEDQNQEDFITTIQHITREEINAKKEPLDQAAKKYHWENEEKKLLNLYNSIIL